MDHVSDGHESTRMSGRDLDLAPHVVLVVLEQRRETRVRPSGARADQGGDDEVIMQAKGRAADEFTVAARRVSASYGPIACDPSRCCWAVVPTSEWMSGERGRVGGSGFHGSDGDEEQNCSGRPRAGPNRSTPQHPPDVSPPPNMQTPHVGRGAGRPDFLLPGSWWGSPCRARPGRPGPSGTVVNVEVPRPWSCCGRKRRGGTCEQGAAQTREVLACSTGG